MNVFNSVVGRRGFNLLELALVLAITSAGSLFLFSNYYALVRSTSLNNGNLDVVLKQQQLTHFFRQMLSSAGQYNIYDSKNSKPENTERELIVKHPIVLPNSYKKKSNLGVSDGQSDSLVVNLMSDVGCNGRRFNYSNGEFFHIVNEVFVQDNVLKCRSYDGRFLTGRHESASRWSSVSLLNGVQEMQVSYLVQTGLTSQYIDANELTHQHFVAAVKLELWFSDVDALITKIKSSLTIFTANKSPESMSTKHQKMMLFIPLIMGKRHD